ncbi:MAG: uracil-DNA glycosylase [Rhodoplanes sp.]
MNPAHAKAATELLAFYLEAGVDALVGEAPVDRLAAGGSDEQASVAAPAPARAPSPSPSLRQPAAGDAEKTARPAGLQIAAREKQAAVRGAGASARDDVVPPASAPARPASAPAAPEAAVMAAREAARQAASLEELAAILSRFEGCTLRATATKLVFADGNPAAPVMFVGEAPGAEEDREGLPFVGRSGRLLDRMMEAIGLDRQSAYVANIIPWRPPGNRTPTPLESQICLPFILRQIELANPDILVCLGAPATQALIGVKDGIMRTRGRWFPYDTRTREIRAIATLHPAYLLRQPLAKRLAWRDFLTIKAALAARSG